MHTFQISWCASLDNTLHDACRVFLEIFGPLPMQLAIMAAENASQEPHSRTAAACGPNPSASPAEDPSNCMPLSALPPAGEQLNVSPKTSGVSPFAAQARPFADHVPAAELNGSHVGPSADAMPSAGRQLPSVPRPVSKYTSPKDFKGRPQPSDSFTAAEPFPPASGSTVSMAARSAGGSQVHRHPKHPSTTLPRGLHQADNGHAAGVVANGVTAQHLLHSKAGSGLQQLPASQAQQSLPSQQLLSGKRQPQKAAAQLQAGQVNGGQPHAEHAASHGRPEARAEAIGPISGTAQNGLRARDSPVPPPRPANIPRESGASCRTLCLQNFNWTPADLTRCQGQLRCVA